MKKINLVSIVVLCIILLGGCASEPNQEVNIIPQPQQVTVVDGGFSLSPKTVINVIKGADDLTPACTFMSTLVEKSFGQPLSVVNGEIKRDAINIAVDPSMRADAYDLTVGKKAIDIKAGSSKAVFYAMQSLRQMMPVGVEKGEKMDKIRIQNVRIQDEPRLAYRGTMLDVCRHFFTVDEVKTFIDMLALHKLSVFHWHLTDDQGWRIEIKKYPKLTEIGSQRKQTVIGKNTGKYDGTPYGPYFFTQEEIKDVIQYAADRYITIIPEIELPGHALAALASYPELGCTGGPYEVCQMWGVFSEVFCPGNEKTFEFWEGVLEEVAELFPGEIIHIGGDECPRDAWKKCKKCQARMKKEKLKEEGDLQNYVVHRIEEFMKTKGKRILGWDEILEGDVSKTAIVMSWRGKKGGIEGAKRGNEVVMVPNDYAYFDYYQAKPVENEPFGIGGYVPVEKVYSLDPTEGLTPEEGEKIIGVQANLWAEYIKTFSHAQYMLLPRMAAIAEVGWTPLARKDYDNFLKRAKLMTQRYEALGYNFAKHILQEAKTNE
ncbi:beta-N-acetylhexosaminidase [Butyricimonas paravirosa]|uniref:beta-N-acetylhexosaminidase n=1 Tax=Butyricimonas paravirosa TaxID=1472417 RepID=UPI00210AE015|nr:beta-N-acetylhexosaminidase [Butyricimonas paravirosa]MCQ4873479.1 beta-N-acetylhexosaminidase [Butyricimonas paravirosa]